MHIELKGRKAIVTGSTAGIGRAIAEGLARAGAWVVINGRTQERVDMALREMRALLPQAELHGIAADIATPEGCAALIAQVPDADVLINNAGTARPNNFFDQTDEEWLNLFHLNVLSGVRLARYYLPKMTARGWGRVVFISSESALNIPKEMIDYGVTKTAVLAVSRGLAELVAGSGVTGTDWAGVSDYRHPRAALMGSGLIVCCRLKRSKATSSIPLRSQPEWSSSS